MVKREKEKGRKVTKKERGREGIKKEREREEKKERKREKKRKKERKKEKRKKERKKERKRERESGRMIFKLNEVEKENSKQDTDFEIRKMMKIRSAIIIIRNKME